MQLLRQWPHGSDLPATWQLADAIGVSRRTVERDIAELKKKGAPIRLTRGRRGGIEYIPDPELAMLVFTRNEATIVLRCMFNAFGKSNWAAARTAIIKLAAALEIELTFDQAMGHYLETPFRQETEG